MPSPTTWSARTKRRFEQRKRIRGNEKYEVVNYVMAFSLLLWTALTRWSRTVDSFDMLVMPAESPVASVVAGVVGHYEVGIASVIASLESLVESSELSPVQADSLRRALMALRVVSNAE